MPILGDPVNASLAPCGKSAFSGGSPPLTVHFLRYHLSRHKVEWQGLQNDVLPLHPLGQKGSPRPVTV